MKQIIVELIENNIVIDKLEFKSLKALLKDDRFSHISYFQLREVYLNSTEKKSKTS